MKKGINLTEGSVLKNLVILSLPIMLSNFIQTFYNLTDAFWLGKLGEQAKDAVSVAGMTFPLVFFISSFGIGFVIAGTALVSRNIGAGSLGDIRKIVSQFFYILIAFTLFFLVISFGFIDLIMTLLNVPPELIPIAKGYMRVIFLGMSFMFIFLSYQSFAHGFGDTVSPMKIQLVSVMLNVFLDPLFIFGYSFFPRLETLGAGYATLIARGIAAVMAVYYFYRDYRIHFPKRTEMKFDAKIMKTILKIGLPASISQSMTSFGFLVLQGFVNSFGTVVISIYSIGNRMTGLFMMPAMGISNALAAIIGQNLGARNVKRAEKSLHTAILLIMIIMSVGAYILYFWGAELTRFFIDDPEVITTGVRMFKVTSFASWAFGLIFIFIGVYNGAGITFPPLLINITRLWVLRIPITYFLAGKLNSASGFLTKFQDYFYRLIPSLQEYPYDSLWWSMLFSNIICAILSLLFFIKGSWKNGKIE
ncbi:MAG: MATE family efflux transporter [Candidatus Cloacimonetes bacterium]|nr:MATE family efflux transporter [Candidatus Cloacimonadota bacterium]